MDVGSKVGGRSAKLASTKCMNYSSINSLDASFFSYCYASKHLMNNGQRGGGGGEAVALPFPTVPHPFPIVPETWGK